MQCIIKRTAVMAELSIGIPKETLECFTRVIAVDLV